MIITVHVWSVTICNVYFSWQNKSWISRHMEQSNTWKPNGGTYYCISSWNMVDHWVMLRVANNTLASYILPPGCRNNHNHLCPHMQQNIPLSAYLQVYHEIFIITRCNNGITASYRRYDLVVDHVMTTINIHSKGRPIWYPSQGAFVFYWESDIFCMFIWKPDIFFLIILKPDNFFWLDIRVR